MAKRNFTIRHFVQNTDIELLEAYFRQANIPFPENLKITEKDKKPNGEAIEQYINSLDVGTQNKINEDFIDINELSYDGGVVAILEVAEIHKLDLQEYLGKLEDNVNQALFCFLNHRQVFVDSTQIAYLERLQSKTVINGLTKISLEEAASENNKEELKEAFKKYFKHKDGRGERCKVDVIKHKDRVFYQVQLQNYSQFLFELDENSESQRNVVKPVFIVIFIYYPSNGKLELNVNFGNKRRKELLDIFNKVVLKDDKALEYGRQTYDFNRIVSPDFSMPTKLEDRVSWAYLKQIRLSYPHSSTKRILLEVDDKNIDGAIAIQEMIKGLNIKIDQLNVTQATFKVKFEGAGNKGSVTAMITYPDKCNLSDTGTHQKVKEYLKDWKLELVDEEGNS